MEWQLKKYADERMHGKNIDGLTVEEKRELKSMMIRDLYPGKNYSTALSKVLVPIGFFFSYWFFFALTHFYILGFFFCFLKP